MQSEAFNALAAFGKVRYIVLCAILVGLLLACFGRKRGWLYGLIAGGLTTLIRILGYRAYWNHLPLWLGVWDGAAETFAIIAPALVAFYVSWLAALWRQSKGSSPGLGSKGSKRCQ
jgi:hypothetical protein